MNNDAFLPADYQPPSSGSGGTYLRFREGVTKFRVLSKAACRGWIYWTDQEKPVRTREKPTGTPLNIRLDDKGKPDKIKPFWALTVWDYEAQEIAILDITQTTVQREIHALYTDSDWGHPNGYDIKVMRSGSGFDTKYLVSPVPHKQFNYALAEGWEQIDLEALFDNGDPFSDNGNGGGNEQPPHWNKLGFNSLAQYTKAWDKFAVINAEAAMAGMGLELVPEKTTLQQLTETAKGLQEAITSRQEELVF